MLRDPQTGKTTPCAVGLELVVGREAIAGQATLVCSDPHVSRRHCRLTGEPDGRLRVVDTSSYGTYINARPVRGEAFAGPGDVLTLGHNYKLVVQEAIDTNAPTVATPSGLQAPSSGPYNPLADTRQGDPLQAPNSPPALVGDRYQVQDVLGEGGMGVVYRAHDRQTDRPCAIKVLRASIKGTQHDEALKRFRREATLTYGLRDHPGIVQVFDTGALQPSGQLYYVMELVDGESLSSKISRGLPHNEGAWLVAQVARSVAYAHDQEVIHRDLKPANVLVAKTGMVHLTDFGVARALDEEESRLTLSGTALGTPSYMAPEQIADSKQAGTAADVYGLGAILYAVLTRRPPFVQKRLGRLIAAVQSGSVQRPRELDPTVDPELESICLKAMAVEPRQRYSSAAALADAIEAWLEKQASTSDDTLTL
jgi:serine/threonine-protein kinase